MVPLSSAIRRRCCRFRLRKKNKNPIRDKKNVPAIEATIAMVVCVTLMAFPWAVITCV